MRHINSIFLKNFILFFLFASFDSNCIAQVDIEENNFSQLNEELKKIRGISEFDKIDEKNNQCQYEITTKKFWENEVDGFVLFLKEDLESVCQEIIISDIEEKFCSNLKNILKLNKFSGKKDESFVLTVTKDEKLVQLIFVGLGKINGLWSKELENLRRAIGTAVNFIKKFNIKESVLAIPQEKPFGITKSKLVEQMIIAAYLAEYKFEKFKNEKKDEWNGKLLFALQDDDEKSYEKNFKKGLIVGNATNFARYLSDLPPNYLTPTSFGQEAKKIAEKYNLRFNIFGREKAKELGMGGFLAVDSGSEQEGKFVILEYITKTENAPTIVFVGKGVTFDSGGISLKSAVNMEGMKFDMAGAAAVVAAMKAIAQLKPDVNVIGITPLVENMPSGKSYRQDDIITFMNGKTAEIKNTDAEGRLILADALCYAEKFYNPDVIIDIATLTGSCIYGLGHYFTGLMTEDEIIGNKLQAVGLVTGDRVWPLPLDEDFKAAIKSEVADLSNCGVPGYKAGTIVAALFLSNFIYKAKWAHLDIAGTAFDVHDINYLGNGATGAGVRLFVEFVMNYN